MINKIESHPKLGRVFHISVSGVKVRNPHAPTGLTTELPHIPVSAATLNSSVVKLLGQSAANPAYMEGYMTWKDAFDNGEAGVFSVGVSEVVEIVEQTIK